MTRRLLLAALALAALAGCASRAQSPAVSLVGMDIDTIGFSQQRFTLQLQVDNPNDMDIPVDRIDFDIEVNGRPFATGASEQPVLIPRRGRAVVAVKAVSRLGNFLRQFREWDRLGREGLDYRVVGVMQVAGYGAVPFDKRGRLALPRQPDLDDNRPAKPLPGAV